MQGDRIPVPLGGMAETVVTKNGVATRILNMHWDSEGFWRETPGTLALTTAAPGSGPVASCAWFNPRPGLRWLVYEVVTSVSTSTLNYLDFPTQTAVQFATRRRIASTDRGTLFLENGRWLYAFSSADAPIRWNGYYTAPVGFTGAAPQPTVAGYDQGFTSMDRAGGDMSVPSYKNPTQQRGVGPFPDTANTYWRYGYAVTMVNELGQESPPSVMQFASGFNGNVVGVGRRMVRVKVPQFPDHIRGTRLYRTRNLIGVNDPGAQATLYFLDEFPTAAGFDYVDNTLDEELGPVFDPDSVGPVPVAPAAAIFWQSSLWLGGSPDRATRVSYSSPLFPEQFPATNYLEIGTVQTGAVVAMRLIQGGILVFKERGIYLIHGNHVLGFQVEALSETVGCAAPRAIEQVHGFGTVFLSDRGPYVVVGGLLDDHPVAVRPLDGMRRTWRRFVGNATNLAASVSVYIAEFNEVWFQVTQGGDIRPNLGLVYHVDLDQWSLRLDWDVSCFTRQFSRTWVGSWDDTNFPGMHLLTYNADNHFGNSAAAFYQGFFTFDEAVKLSSVEVWVLAAGAAAPMDLNTVTDRQSSFAQTQAGKSQKLNRTDIDLWGAGLWSSTAQWSAYNPTRLSISTRMVTGREIGVSVLAQRMRVFAMQLVVTPTIHPDPERHP